MSGVHRHRYSAQVAHTPNRATHSAARFAVPPTAALAGVALPGRKDSGRVGGQRGSSRNVWLIGGFRLGHGGRVANTMAVGLVGLWGVLKSSYVLVWCCGALWWGAGSGGHMHVWLSTYGRHGVFVTFGCGGPAPARVGAAWQRGSHPLAPSYAAVAAWRNARKRHILGNLSVV